jgi:hypothetical protein
MVYQWLSIGTDAQWSRWPRLEQRPDETIATLPTRPPVDDVGVEGDLQRRVPQ